eukprot:1276190-Pleurochrysis_carterae.AAC.1
MTATSRLSHSRVQSKMCWVVTINRRPHVGFWTGGLQEKGFCREQPGLGMILGKKGRVLALSQKQRPHLSKTSLETTSSSIPWLLNLLGSFRAPLSQSATRTIN